MPAIKTRTVPALHRALGILELLTHSRAGLTLPELVEQSGMAKSSAHYLLVTLERRGYVRRSERTGRYLLGIRLFSLANSRLTGLELRQRSTTHLSNLRMRTGLTVHMAILEQNEAILVGKQEPLNGTRVATWLGKRMDLHCTALGKALLAFSPEAEINSIVRKHGLARHNENTISTSRRLHEELDRVVKMGFALDDEEDELGLRCVGIPIFGSGERPFAAISVSGTTCEIGPERLPQLFQELRQTAMVIHRAVCESMTPDTVDSVA